LDAITLLWVQRFSRFDIVPSCCRDTYIYWHSLRLEGRITWYNVQKSLKAANNRPTHNKSGGANIQKGRKGLSLLAVMGSTLVMVKALLI